MGDSESTHKNTRRVSSGRLVRAVALGVLCIVLAIAALNVLFRSRRTELPGPSPPDLSHCTRIEIRQYPITMGYPVWRTQAEKDLLTPEEVQQIETLLEFVVDGPERVNSFARTIASGSYNGRQSGTYRTKIVAVLLCYFGDKPPLRLVAYEGWTLVTEDKQVFDYDPPLNLFGRIVSQVRSSELLPQIRLRLECARNLRYLYTGLRGFGSDVAYPPAPTWCSVAVRRCVSRGDPEKTVLEHLACPSVPTVGCHYAMNAKCKPDSPPDTVLLFETKDGWNQHGGPDMCTFDNHDPKGGCVLLNDGTVKFIRTEEELHALRWE
jgi:hypothetical protein